MGVLACIGAVFGIVDVFVLIFHPFSRLLSMWSVTALCICYCLPAWGFIKLQKGNHNGMSRIFFARTFLLGGMAGTTIYLILDAIALINANASFE